MSTWAHDGRLLRADEIADTPAPVRDVQPHANWTNWWDSPLGDPTRAVTSRQVDHLREVLRSMELSPLQALEVIGAVIERVRPPR